ncbi:hypothetical protein AAFM71_09790 [Chromobacterium violaceum]|uniref:hypothetical protein n=1 Tax=Chromobacterium violaceum TaxID=536 RepID=UPI00126A0C5F|nr:hypothetical protein [Chromobacterium violaceum]MBT2866287.1 hypothetical protein [Chromobacterium violaceum]
MNFLQTIFPPFTNRNVQLLVSKANQRIAQHLRQSKFYMIGARAQASFVNPRIDKNEAKIYLEVQVGTEVVDTGAIHLAKCSELPDNCEIKVTDEAVLLGGTKKGTHARVWLTPDSVYWHMARGTPYLEGFTRHDLVCDYDLLYVGIAKQQDSYQRLIKNAHHGRLRVLSEERARKPGAHPSDEVILFLFDIEPFGIQTISPEDDDDYELFQGADSDRVIADAEKAFVSLLDPHYNVTKFQNYPKGGDGLYKTGLNSYGYILNENFRFNTTSSRFKGFWSEMGFDNRQDSIFVEGDKVELHFGSDTKELPLQGVDSKDTR